MKKNNTAEKAALNAQKISQALKESTENSLKSLMNEAITNMIMEEDDKDEDDYDVEDVDTEETDSDENACPICKDGECECEDGSCDVDDACDDDDEWSDMEDYKVGDNNYDFTDAEDDEVLKVYNKLGDDDKIFVKKDGDGKYELSDGETGAEYVIELNDADLDDDEPEDDETEIDVDLDDEEPEDDETEIDVDLDDDEPEDDETEIEITPDEPEDDDEIEIDVENDDDDDMLSESWFENNYQKDVMPGLNMDEPADSKTTNDWDGGAPRGNGRPYGHSGDGKPFEKNVDESEDDECICEIDLDEDDMNTPMGNLQEDDMNMDNIQEDDDMQMGNLQEDDDMQMGNLQEDDMNMDNIQENGVGHNARRKTSKTWGRVHSQGWRRNHSEDGEYHDGLTTESMYRIYNKARSIQKENKQYAKSLKAIKESLKQAMVCNVALGQVVKLLKENTTSKDEKEAIVERFNNVKSINECKNLYKTIKNELNGGVKPSVMLEHTISAKSSNILNETKMYNNRTSNAALDLMMRLDELKNNQ